VWRRILSGKSYNYGTLKHRDVADDPKESSAMIEEIRHLEHLLAIIVRDKFDKPGISFFTANDLSQQLAYMRHPTGKVIEPHIHNAVRREVRHTQETLFIKRGKLRVDFYDDKQEYLHSRVLEAGDVILLVTGGHGFEVLEEVQMIEVKQGPYAGDIDKTRFAPTSNWELKILRE
jgi:hypothetical protein